MMASKQSAAAAFASDDEGQDYDPAHNYSSASDYEEDRYQHTQAPSSKTAAPPPAAQQHNYGYSDDDSEDDYYNQQQQRHSQHARQVVSPSSVALPTSPVSSRGGPGAGGYDSYNDRRDSYPTPSSHVAPVAASATTPAAGAIADAPILSSRNSWEENDSDDNEPYPADAYDYGQEEESSSGDEYEERPRSTQVLKQQQQPQAFHGHSDRDSSEDEFEERPRSHLQHQQQQRQSQQPAATVQGHNDAADSNHSEDEYEERPRSHIQQQQPRPSSSNHYHADSQSEDEFEERPRSHQQQQQYNDYRAADSQSEDEYEERPRSHVQQRQSTQSSHAHTEIAQVAQKEQQAKNPYNYDSDHSRSSSEDHRQPAPISAPVAAIAPVHHQEEKQHNGRFSTESFDRRSSYAEEKVVPTVTQAAPVHYGSDSDSDDDYKPALASPVVHHQQPKEASFGDFGEEPLPHNNMFQSSALDPRASVNSAKSFSSHTKHHSFGYDERPTEHDVPSESESGSSSETDESEKNKLKELSSTLMSAAAVAPITTTQAPPIPNKSRPTSTFSLASHNSLASPRSPTFTRSMGSPVAERLEQPAATRAPDSPTFSAASAPVIAAAAAAAVAAATAAVVANPPTSVPATALTPAPVTPAAPISPPSPPPKDTIPLAVDTVSQKSASSTSSLDARQKTSGYDSDTSGTSIDLHSPTYKSQSSKMTPPSVFTRTFSSSSSGGAKDAKVNNGPASPERTRPISYATVFSDADMNDVNLMDEPQVSGQRASVVVPRTPVTPSAFGFASGFFGGAAARSQPTPPPPPSRPFSSSQPQQVPLPATPAQATPSTPVAPTPPPKTNDTRSRSTSISAFASTIGAFARGFSSLSQPPVPPMPARTPSQISQRTSNAPAPSTFAAFGQQQQQQDPRNSSANRSMASTRASTISNATNDSNMDMLLARLEAQNELLAQESKRRATTESDMDRALNHAKEEAAPGDDVDWDYWGALMHDYNGVVRRNPKQLTTMIQRGVPSALRGLIWQLLAKSKDAQLEATFAELLKSTSSHEKQITRDMTRTFPNHEYFTTEGGVGQEALFNVAKAYSLYDPEVGYCQGISFIVGPLLLNMPEEEAFCMLVRMMQTYEMRGHYTPDMEKLQLRLYQFEQLMEETVPMVFKHLRNQGIRSTMYASQWFMTVFAYKFPLELVFRVYDILLVEGADALLRFAIALLKMNHDRILSLDFEVLIEFLKHGLFEPYMNDAGLFIRDAYEVKVTPKKLQQYAQKYQALLQKQQAELAAEENLRESNRLLSTQVRTLEGSLHQLNKEHVDLAKELITRKLDMAQLSDRNDVLEQKVSDLVRIVDSQGKEVEEQYKGEIEDVLRKNMEILKKNEQLEDQLAYMESLLVETKMKYAESEIERDSLSRKLSDMRKALVAT
ncbi:GTPase-activating protein [Mortierella hygrophila]|uniref:GTPase-activating protein n=1 Tax=Mortierella hygrophila TaxID=979708 RepID=A0A9P6K6I0_9FUNG|nr:GTPase-activating protein [Mortierella hygrophila]